MTKTVRSGVASSDRPNHVVGVVLIGRNEGERLVSALTAAQQQLSAIVYVDSGSTDNSLQNARNAQAQVVQLDLSRPFNAARARNDGFAALIEQHPHLLYCQFIDGDCELETGWLTTACQSLDQNASLAAVCGRRREKYPDRSIYNRMIDVEWDRPIGPTDSCGGDSLMRVSAFQQVGGFDSTVIAGEEPELCRRLRAVDWRIERLDEPMTIHDAAISSFSQWWRRDVRSGYGSMDVYTRTRDSGQLFVHQVRSVRRWTIGWLSIVIALTALSFLSTWFVPLVLITAMAWPAQAARVSRFYRRHGVRWSDSLVMGAISLIGKWGQLIGQIRYFRRRSARESMGPIEYKKNAT